MLEYLYKGDYSPKLAFDKKRGSWYLEDNDGITGGVGENAINQGGVGGAVLKDTIIYVSSYSIYILFEAVVTKTLLSAQPIATISPSCNGWHSRSKVSKRASNAAPSCPLLVMPTPTRPPATQNLGHTTSLSSSEVAILSSEAAPCRWRCRMVGRRCSLTSSWRW